MNPKFLKNLKRRPGTYGVITRDAVVPDQPAAKTHPPGDADLFRRIASAAAQLVGNMPQEVMPKGGLCLYVNALMMHLLVDRGFHPLPQCGSVAVSPDMGNPDDTIMMDSRDGGIDRGEFHVWTVVPVADGTYLIDPTMGDMIAALKAVAARDEPSLVWDREFDDMAVVPVTSQACPELTGYRLLADPTAIDRFSTEFVQAVRAVKPLVEAGKFIVNHPGHKAVIEMQVVARPN